MKKDFLKSYVGYDPIPYWKNVLSPVFIAFGEGDKNLPVDESIERFLSNLQISFELVVGGELRWSVQDECSFFVRIVERRSRALTTNTQCFA